VIFSNPECPECRTNKSVQRKPFSNSNQWTYYGTSNNDSLIARLRQWQCTKCSTEFVHWEPKGNHNSVEWLLNTLKLRVDNFVM